LLRWRGGRARAWKRPLRLASLLLSAAPASRLSEGAREAGSLAPPSIDAVERGPAASGVAGFIAASSSAAPLPTTGDSGGGALPSCAPQRPARLDAPGGAGRRAAPQRMRLGHSDLPETGAGQLRARPVAWPRVQARQVSHAPAGSLSPQMLGGTNRFTRVNTSASMKPVGTRCAVSPGPAACRGARTSYTSKRPCFLCPGFIGTPAPPPVDCRVSAPAEKVPEPPEPARPRARGPPAPAAADPKGPGDAARSGAADAGLGSGGRAPAAPGTSTISPDRPARRLPLAAQAA